jgi:acetyltransferase-like isoleucine patch superfamily enzyme
MMPPASQFRQHLKFSWGNVLRLWYYQRRLGDCGDKVFFDKNVEIQRFLNHISIGDQAAIKEGAHICACNAKATIQIGQNTTVGYYTFIFASERIKIGDNCLIAPFAYIVDSDHGIERKTLINQQANLTAPIEIGNDVWVGTGAKILKGVTIGEGAVIAAGAVVKDSVSPYQIVGGIPARVLGERP